VKLARAPGVVACGDWYLSPIGLSLLRIRPRLPGALALSAEDMASRCRLAALAQAGIALPVAPLGPPLPVTAIIPARDPDPDRLARLVTALTSRLPGARVVVVDDGSVTPIVLPAPAEVVRTETALGPAAARNLGAAHATSELLLFVDADVEGLPDELSGAMCLLRLPEVVAASPRIVGARGYDPLDLGPHSAAVSRRTRIGHLGACVLALRRSDFIAVGGFDETLRLGEDVELVHRLTCEGGLALHLGGVVATHAHRRLPARLARAFAYGYSSAALAKKIPRVLPNARTLAIAAASLAPGGPLLVPGLATLRLIARSRSLRRKLVLATLSQALLEMARLAARSGAVALGLLGNRTRSQALLIATIVATSEGPTALACDLAYSLGVASGVLLERT